MRRGRLRAAARHDVVLSPRAGRASVLVHRGEALQRRLQRLLVEHSSPVSWALRAARSRPTRRRARECELCLEEFARSAGVLCDHPWTSVTSTVLRPGGGAWPAAACLCECTKNECSWGGCFESAQQECDSGAIHEARLMTRAVAGNDKAKT